MPSSISGSQIATANLLIGGTYLADTISTINNKVSNNYLQAQSYGTGDVSNNYLQTSFSSGPEVGQVIQSVSATTGFGTTKQVIYSTTKQAVTGLSVTITPQYSNSKMLIFGVFVSSATYVVGLAIYKNGSSLITNNTQTLQTDGTKNLWTIYGDHTTSQAYNFAEPFMYEDTVSNTNATTYQIYANSGYNGNRYNLHINDRSSDDMRSQSWITVQEIRA